MNHSILAINLMGMLCVLMSISMAKDQGTKNSSISSSNPRIKSITVALHLENPTPFSEGCSVLLKRADKTLEQRDISLRTSQSVRFDLNNRISLDEVSEYHIEFRRTNFLLTINPLVMSVEVTGELEERQTVVLHEKENAFFGGPLWNVRSYALKMSTGAIVKRQPQAPSPTPTPKKSLEVLVKQANAGASPNPSPGTIVSTPTPGYVAAQIAKTPLKSLSVKITTANDPLGALSDLPPLQDVPGLVGLPKAGGVIGQSDDVWFDIGPKAWDLGHDWPAGKEVLKDLNVDGLGLFEEDLTEVRLEKKGILGFTNAPDSFYYGVGYIPSVADAIGKLRQAVQRQEYAVSLAKSVLAEKDKALQEANTALDKALDAEKATTALLNDAAGHLKDLEDWQNELQHVGVELATTPLEIEEKVFDWLVHWITNYKPNPMIPQLRSRQQELKNKIDALKATGIDWTSRKAKAAADLQADIEVRVAKTEVKAGAEAAYQIAKFAIDKAESLLRFIQQKLVDLEAVAQKLPSFSLGLPMPGQWKPERMILIVNGKEKTYKIGEWLRRGHYSWMRTLGTMSQTERFVLGLRIELPPAAKPEQDEVWDDILKHPTHFFDHPDLITDVFKNSDISGWEYYQKGALHVPIGAAKVIGKLVREPSEGTDANVSLDLEVQGVEAEDRHFVLTDPNKSQKRYLRIEYQFGTDQRFTDWHVGDRFEVEGPVRWDTDKSGFFEIHPVGKSSVRKLPPL